MALGKDNVWVATCDQEITTYIQSIGGNAVMTSVHHQRVCTRASEALSMLEKIEDDDIVVVIQGDEPLISPSAIESVVAPFFNEDISIANLLSIITNDVKFRDKNNVKAVISEQSNLMYLSREAIPSDWTEVNPKRRLLQTGVIAFTVEALMRFNEQEETYLEKIESIDINRALERGERVKGVVMETPTLGVDTHEELLEAEQMLLADPVTRLYLDG